MQDSRYRAVTALVAVLLAFGGPLTARAEETIRIGGTGAALGLVRQLGTAFERQHRDVRIVIAPSIGSRGGIKAVARGVLDIGISSRPLGPDEESLGLTGHEFARTPFVLAAGISRSGSALTLAEVVDIYLGDTTTWPDGERIRLVLRSRSDTDSMIIRSLSPSLSAALDAALDRRGMLIASTDQENADLLTTVPGAIGFTSLTQIVTEHRQLAALTLDGFPPATAAGVNTSYPHFKHLFIIVPREPASAIGQFLSFLRSSTARRIIVDGGAIAVPLGTEHAP